MRRTRGPRAVDGSRQRACLAAQRNPAAVDPVEARPVYAAAGELAMRRGYVRQTGSPGMR